MRTNRERMRRVSEQLLEMVREAQEGPAARGAHRLRACPGGPRSRIADRLGAPETLLSGFRFQEQVVLSADDYVLLHSFAGEVNWIRLGLWLALGGVLSSFRPTRWLGVILLFVYLVTLGATRSTPWFARWQFRNERPHLQEALVCGLSDDEICRVPCPGCGPTRSWWSHRRDRSPGSAASRLAAHLSGQHSGRAVEA